MNERTNDQGREWRNDLRNPWLLAVIGLVVAALAANVTMITMANVSSPGLVSEDYYERGSNYFAAERKRRADEEGVRVHALLPDVPRLDQAQTYRLYAVDETNAPLSGEAELAAFRPDDADADFTVPMRRIDPGSYVAEVAFPRPGQWDLILTVRSGDRSVDIARHIFVRD